MSVGYNRIVAITLIVLGGLDALLGLWLSLLGSFSYSLIIGIVILWLGVLYLRRPYFVVEKNQVVMPALLGPRQRTYFFKTPADLKLEDNKLFVRADSQWKRVPVYRWMSDPTGWKVLDAQLTRA